MIAIKVNLDYNQDMTRELIIYICTCFKCGHIWNTKTHDKPEVCSKCHRKTWNDDEQVITPIETPETVEPIREHRFTDVAMNPALDQFLAKHAAIEPQVVETVENWQFKKGEKPEPNDDGRIYRKQYLMPVGKVTRIVRVDDDDFDTVLNIVRK